MDNIDAAIALVGLAGLCLIGAHYFIEEEKKSLRRYKYR